MRVVGSAVVLALWFALAACRGGERSASTSAVLRIVSLHDVTTEIVVALDGGRHLVAVAEAVDAAPSLLSAIAGVPRVADAETILSVEPTLLLGLDIVRQKSRELVSELERRHTAVYLPELRTLDDVDAMIRAIGARIGADEAAAKLALGLRERVGSSPRDESERARVFVYDCCDPPFTAGKNTLLTDLIERAGGRNIFGDVDSAWTHVSWEEALRRHPALVIVNAYDDEKKRDAKAKIETLRAIAPFRDLPVTVAPLRYWLGGLAAVEGVALLRSAIAGGAR